MANRDSLVVPWFHSVPCLVIGVIVFISHVCGKPFGVALLKRCAVKGAEVCEAKEKSSPSILVWSWALLCYNLLVAFSNIEVVKKVEVVGQGCGGCGRGGWSGM